MYLDASFTVEMMRLHVRLRACLLAPRYVWSWPVKGRQMLPNYWTTLPRLSSKYNLLLVYLSSAHNHENGNLRHLNYGHDASCVEALNRHIQQHCCSLGTEEGIGQNKNIPVMSSALCMCTIITSIFWIFPMMLVRLQPVAVLEAQGWAAKASCMRSMLVTGW